MKSILDFVYTEINVLMESIDLTDEPRMKAVSTLTALKPNCWKFLEQ